MVTLLITGFPKSGRGRIEIIKENFDTEVCTNIPEYSLQVDNAAGSYWKDGKLLICGGNEGIKMKSECYIFKNGEWLSNIENLQTSRSLHGISNHEDFLWITGGKNGTQRLASTEIIYPDGKVTSGPNLPEARDGHCQLSYGQTIFILGKCTLLLKLGSNPISISVFLKILKI